ncbi:MAG TPA: glycosyltransferase family 2 protein [Candidatus Rubrimentiphilum sp.]|nr:glycosyltransferase family 2 protein [Candidatus Rubrimentiphilum sp.]
MTGSSQPLVSIVTPSFNSAPFLRECIESVLAQEYPHIEYVVMDGGSTDETPAILERYRDRIARVHSAPDFGQAEAINRGLAEAQGEIVAFLNADDAYLPGAVGQAVRAFAAHPGAAVVYGNAYHVAAGGEVVAAYPTQDFDRAALARTCYICQPAAFVRRQAFERVGAMNPSLHYVLDYDLWLRLAAIGPFVRIEPFLAKSRIHAGSKSVSNRKAFYREVFSMLQSHYGYVPYEWVQGYASSLIEGNDQFFTTPGHTFAAAGLSLALGSWINRRRIGLFFRDWLAHRTIGKKFLQRR